MGVDENAINTLAPVSWAGTPIYTTPQVLSSSVILLFYYRYVGGGGPTWQGTRSSSSNSFECVILWTSCCVLTLYGDALSLAVHANLITYGSDACNEGKELEGGGGKMEREREEARGG